MTQKHKYFVDAEVDRIPLEDGDWVDIKHRLSIRDQDLIGEKLMEIELDTSTSREERRRRRQAGEFPGKAKFKPSTVVLLEMSIVDWSFTYPDGSKVPVTVEMIGKMEPALANQLEEEIDQRNPLSQTPQSSTSTPFPEGQLPSLKKPEDT